MPKTPLEQTEEFQKLVENFQNRPPAQIITWNDDQTNAKGWLVIDYQSLGAAGGGIRMHENLQKETMLELAKDMSLKFTQLNPRIGGAKSGIRFNPRHPEKQAVMQRFLQHIKPHLQQGYGTGGDLNVSAKELLTALNDVEIPHPQYGIVTAVKNAGYPINIHTALDRLKKGVTLPSDASTLVELSTGRGVAEAARVAILEIQPGNEPSIRGKTAAIQGFGTVGGSTAKYFHENGGKVIAISDETGTILNQNGLDIPHLLKNRKNGIIDRTKLSNAYQEEKRDALIEITVDVLVPAADSNLITKKNADKITAKIIVEGANTPATPEADEIIFEKGITLIPDFIANVGTACLFHQCMFTNTPIQSETLLENIGLLVGNNSQTLLTGHNAKKHIQTRLYAEANAIIKIKQKL